MSDILKNLSDALAETTAQVGASVVRVEGRRRLAATGLVWSSDSAGSLIVTANHVVERDDELKIGLPNGQTVDAKLVGRDPSSDLAALRISAGDLPVPTWVEPSDLRVGHLALALGRPNRSVMATFGVISALEDGSQLPGGMQLDYLLQTDVVMYPGFSGGPLVMADGRVAGLNTSGLARGISLAVPVPTLRRVVDALARHGRLRRGYLGIGAQPVRLPAGLASQVGQEMGLMIVSVEPNSPAEQGKLFMGDTILAMEGQPMREPDDLVRALTGDWIGRTVKLRIVRGGEVREAQVVVGERPSQR